MKGHLTPMGGGSGRRSRRRAGKRTRRFEPPAWRTRGDVLPVARRAPGNASYPIATRVAVAGFVSAMVVAVLVLRLWGLTIVSGEHYVELAADNHIRKIPVEASRGAILDRNGRPLVTNRPATQVLLYIDEVRPEGRPELYRNLSWLLGMPVTEIMAKVANHVDDPLEPIRLSTDLQDRYIRYYLAERARDFPGVQLNSDYYTRTYPLGQTAAHILGQIGEVSPEELEGEFRNRKAGDRIGKSGLEYEYDEYLRGTDGYRNRSVDAAGVPQESLAPPGLAAVDGNNLRLTIDYELQRATEAALRSGLQIANASKEGRGAYAGAAVAMDPNTGEVLSITSAPTYNPNIFVTQGYDAEIRRVLQNERSPMTNRAIAGLYPAASTFKVITGLAALAHGYVTTDQIIECPSSLTIAGTKFRNWYPEGLGGMDMAEALSQSCDTYFYRIAADGFYNALPDPEAGISGTPLQDFARKFVLGIPTGIDVPGEEAGVVPTPQWRAETFEGQQSVWGPGHSVNLSIGQGDLLVTPLQMTAAYAAIANGGTWYRPHLARAVEDPSGKQVLALPAPEGRNLGIPEHHMQAIHDGLYRAAHSAMGTSSAVFSSFPIPVAGKTGTGEKPPYGDMAWYCGYAPADEPTIVACAIIEGGGHGGSTAAPVVLKMFQQFFHKDGGNITPNTRSD